VTASGTDDRSEDRDVHREIGQRHHERPRKIRATGAQGPSLECTADAAPQCQASSITVGDSRNLTA